MHYLGRPAYTTDVSLRIYLRYPASGVSLPETLGFSRIREQYSCDDYRYVVGDPRCSSAISRSFSSTATDFWV